MKLHEIHTHLYLALLENIWTLLAVEKQVKNQSVTMNLLPKADGKAASFNAAESQTHSLSHTFKHLQSDQTFVLLLPERSACFLNSFSGQKQTSRNLNYNISILRHFMLLMHETLYVSLHYIYLTAIVIFLSSTSSHMVSFK